MTLKQDNNIDNLITHRYYTDNLKLKHRALPSSALPCSAVLYCALKFSYYSSFMLFKLELRSTMVYFAPPCSTIFLLCVCLCSTVLLYAVQCSSVLYYTNKLCITLFVALPYCSCMLYHTRNCCSMLLCALPCSIMTFHVLPRSYMLYNVPI